MTSPGLEYRVSNLEQSAQLNRSGLLDLTAELAAERRVSDTRHKAAMTEFGTVHGRLNSIEEKVDAFTHRCHPIAHRYD